MKLFMCIAIVFWFFQLNAQEDRQNLNDQKLKKAINSSGWHGESLENFGPVIKATFSIMTRADEKFAVAIQGELSDGTTFAFVSDCAC